LMPTLLYVELHLYIPCYLLLDLPILPGPPAFVHLTPHPEA
jgi:hypothetical protein